MADEDRRDARAAALVDAHTARSASILEALLRALLGLWGGFRHWENRDLVYAHAARSAVLVDTSMNKTRMLARSYATGMLRELDAEPRKALPRIEDIYPRSGATLLEVYQRPINQYLYERTAGVTEAEARAHALDRFEELAHTDLMLAERDETQKVFAASPKVIGRRRIIRPERSESGMSCGLCVVAADRIYKVSELSPIHDGCNCTDMAITADYDPGFTLNRDELTRLYAAAGEPAPGSSAGGSTFGDDLKRIRVGINEHGELGPVLSRAEHEFRGTKEVNENSRKQFKPYAQPNINHQKESWADMRDSAQRSIELLLNPNPNLPAPDGDVDQAIKYHRDLIARLEQKLR